VTVVTGADDSGGTTLQFQHRAAKVMPFERFHIELNLHAVGNDPAAIKADLDKRLAAALDSIKQFHDVQVQVGALVLVRQTPEINPRMAQRFADGGMSAPPELWKGTQLITSGGKDKEGLQGALTELQKQGAILTELHFELTEDTRASARQQLTADAIRALRAEASQVAAAMDMQIGRYSMIQVTEENDQRQIQLRQIRIPQNGEPLTLPSGEIEEAVAVGIRVALVPKSNP
jgi:predicted secreted protein